MKILVTGAKGMLGHDLCPILTGAGHEVIRTDVMSDDSRLDITDTDSIHAFLKVCIPTWVINCAAFTRVDACESDEPSATLLNGTAPGYIAEECKRLGIRLLHVSTDYVFDGTKTGPYREDDPVNPINAYGRSKLKGEQEICSRMKDYILVRTQWLFGKNGPNFVDTILKLARERGSIDVVNDQFGSPTYTKDLAKALLLLIEKEARGVFHVCNRGSASWYELAKRAVDLSGIKASLNPVTSDKFPRPAKRPANSILSTRKFTETTGRLMPPWQIALEEYLSQG